MNEALLAAALFCWMTIGICVAVAIWLESKQHRKDMENLGKHDIFLS